MAEIGYGYGSEWHLLRYMGRHRNALNSLVVAQTGGVGIEWLDHPFSSNRAPLRQDREFQGLDFLRANHHLVTDAWATFWPQTGNAQNWDALGVLRKRQVAGDDAADGGLDWLLVEAKAHTGELESHMGATATSSIDMITNALKAVAGQVTRGKDTTPEWFGPYYQYANRLAALHFLHENNIPAHLVFVYFYGETGMENRDCPQTELAWAKPLQEMYNALDLNPDAPLLKRVHSVFVPVLP